MTLYGVFVILFIPVCFTASIKGLTSGFEQQSESLEVASTPGDMEDCDDYEQNSQDNVFSSGITTASGSSDFLTESSSETALSTDFTSDASADDCDEYASLSDMDENSNIFIANGNSSESTVTVAPVNENSTTDYYDYPFDDCYYNDYNGTFSNCSSYNGSFSYSSDYYDYDTTTNYSNNVSSTALPEVQIINQTTGIQQYLSNNEGASSISVANVQNQEFANAAVSNQNPTTDQNIGIVPFLSSEVQGLISNIPVQDQGVPIQQYQENNNGFSVNPQNLGQFGNVPGVGQTVNQGQLQSPFAKITGFQNPVSRIPAVQQYQSTNNGGGVLFGSGQNPSQLVKSFFQRLAANQNPPVRQYRNTFSENQQYPVQNALAGSGSLNQIQRGFGSNGPAGSNFGTGPTLNFQQNSGIVPPYSKGENNPGFASVVAGSGISSQI